MASFIATTSGFRPTRMKWQLHASNRLHDAAFDQGLIAFDDDLRLILSAHLKLALSHEAAKASFEAHEGKSLGLPGDAIQPDAGFLAKHRKIFKFAA